MKYFSIGYKKLFGIFMIILQTLKQLKTHFLTKLWPLLFVPVFYGCEDNASLAQLCSKNKEICEEFGQDSWCKSQRIDVALGRIKVKNNELDADKYNLMVSYEGYIKCMELASQIQHIKLKEKTTLRKNNLLKAKANLSFLVEQSADSKHPHLLFYNWSRYSDKIALEEFLSLEGSPSLENSTAQFHLATYYIKRDSKKTLGLLYRALELHEPGTILSDEILQSLATIHTKLKQYKQAYIWLRAYQLIQKKPKVVIEDSLNNYQQTHALDGNFLDDVASATLSKIEAGKFTSPRF